MDSAYRVTKNGTVVYKICPSLPPMVNSDGVWEFLQSLTNNPISYSLPRLNLQLIVIFLVTEACHFLLRRVGMTKLASQILAGIILGPNVFGHFSGKNARVLFTIESQELLDVITDFSFLIFIVLEAVKMDITMVPRAGRTALCTGVASMLTPLLLGLVSLVKLSAYWHIARENMLTLLIVAVTHSLTPFPNVPYLLSDLKILNSELGRLALSSALVSDALSMFLQFIVNMSILAAKTQAYAPAIGRFALVLVYMVFVAKVMRPAMRWIIKETPEGRPVKDSYVYAIVMYFIASSMVFYWSGLPLFIAPFLMGLAVPSGPPLGSALETKLDCFASNVFVPIFTTTRVMRANFLSVKFDSIGKVNLIVIIIIIAAKFAACLVPPLILNIPKRDTLALAFILSNKGMVDLGAYTLHGELKGIPNNIYPFMVAVLLLTTIIAPYGTKYFYDPSRKYAGYQRRNLLHLKPNAELRIVTTIHRPDNVAAVINLLDATSPSKEESVALYALHLIEQVGRASPVFISHRMQKKTLSMRSCSKNIILAFDHYQQERWGAVSAEVFTAISPSKLMHEDVCILAVNKEASLIVMPFHRKWSADGSLESDDKKVRALNCHVMERSPCSVGVLVDRGRLGCFSSLVSSSAQSPFRVATIFLGGSDDREALTLAKRMAKGTNITLDVLHLTCHTNKEITSWDNVYDTEVLKDVKPGSNPSSNVSYREEMAEDGPHTALIIRTMVNKYDLIMVGRRHNIASPQILGLHEWSEFPELGVIGDLLATIDSIGRFSILVVQQQII